jgi:Parvulin-like peptidyl-prolyl isomerase
MKKTISMLIFAFMLVLCMGQTSLGADTPKTGEQIKVTKIKVDFGSINIISNGKQLNTRVVTYNNMEYVPLKDICFYLNSSLVENIGSKTAEILTGKKPNSKLTQSGKALPKGTKTIDAYVNQYKITVNSIDSYLDSFTYNNIVFVPLQHAAEIFNKKLTKDDISKVINLNDISDTLIGSINGEKLMLSELDTVYNLQSNAPVSGTADEIKAYKTKIFNYLVERKILLQKFEESKTTLSTADFTNINASLKQVISNYGGISSFRKMLTDKKVNLYRFSNLLKEDYIINNIFIVQLGKQVAATENEVRQYYDLNSTSYVNPETVTAKHILISTLDTSGAQLAQDKKDAVKKKAEDILSQLKAGADFDKLMSEYSEDPGLKSYPNGYTFSKGQMIQDFEDAAFALKPGEISGIVETKYGYHIIKLIEKTPQKQLTYEEVKADIKNNLDNNEKQKFINNILNYWKSVSKVENKLKL